MKKDLLSIKDLTAPQINGIFGLTDDLKRKPKSFSSLLKGRSLALIFEKPSNRTYVSFQVGMFQLGGNAIYLGPEHIKLGVRETIHDVAKTLSRYVSAIVLRTFAHSTVLDMAAHASVPVINGLSDLTHPCQGLTDLYSIKEKLGSLKGITVAYIGDGNNVCHSLLYGCAKLGVNLSIATPLSYEPSASIVKEACAIAKKTGAIVVLTHSPAEAAAGADVLYTDVWASMGQEKEAALRKEKFSGFQVNRALLKVASKKALVMHCLPAHRGEEIADEVLASSHSIVFDQAENRLHVQKAILIKLLCNV